MTFRTLTVLATVLLMASLGVGCFDFGDSGTDAQGGRDVPQDGSAVTGLAALHGVYLRHCARCHAPGAPGATSETEKSLDFSTVETTRRTLRGKATGLVGNQQACNGASFLGATWRESLLVAVLDEDLRRTFMAPGYPECNGATGAVSAMETRVGVSMPATFLPDLRAWIDAGAP